MGNVSMVKQRVSEEVASSSIVAPYGFHTGGDPDVDLRLGVIANLPDVRTDFAIEAICKCSLDDDAYKWLSNATKAKSIKDVRAQVERSVELANDVLKSDEQKQMFADAIERLIVAYGSLRNGIFLALEGKEELSWGKIKDFTTDISTVIGFLAGQYPLWKGWTWVEKLVYMVVGNDDELDLQQDEGLLRLPARINIKIGEQPVAVWKRMYGAFKPFVTTAMRARLQLLGIILKILNIEDSSLLYYDLFRSASRWKELSSSISGGEIGSYGTEITSRMLRAFSEAKEGCLPVLAKGRPAIADYMALVLVLGQAMVDIDYTVHLEGLKEGIPLTWENYGVQVRYALILNEDVFEIAYQREIETTWSQLGPRWEQGDRPAPLALPWLRGRIDACTVVSIPKQQVLTSDSEDFVIDLVTVEPETYDLTENKHYDWLGCELTKAGWLVPSEPDAYDRPTIVYLSSSDVPVTVGIARKPFSNSIFDVSIDVAMSKGMTDALDSIYGKDIGYKMGVGRIFRDKGIVFKWAGDLPEFSPVADLIKAVPEFAALLRAARTPKKED